MLFTLTFRCLSFQIRSPVGVGHFAGRPSGGMDAEKEGGRLWLFFRLRALVFWGRRDPIHGGFSSASMPQRPQQTNTLKSTASANRNLSKRLRSNSKVACGRWAFRGQAKNKKGARRRLLYLGERGNTALVYPILSLES